MPDAPLTADALLSLLRDRRSVRRFRPDPVPEAMITALAEAARWAPSANNRQAFRLVAVTSPERLREMAAAVTQRAEALRGAAQGRTGRDAGAFLASALHFAGAPLVFAVLHRRGGTLAEAIADGRIPPPPIEAETLASAAAAIQNLLLCAQITGLGACWMTGPLVAEEALAPLLGVAAGWALTALVPIGFPAEAPAAPPRRPLTTLLRHL